MKTRLLLFLFFFSYNVYSQTYIKLNGATSLVGVPGIGIEVPISKKFTFQLDATMSFWNSVTIDKFSSRPYVFNQIIPEVRYYINNVNDGLYFGTHFGYGMFKLSKNSSYASQNKYQYGYILFAGISTGYQWQFKDRWLVDAFIGGGWSKATYEGFEKNTGTRYDINSNVNFSAQWIPYRGGIMIGYRF